MLAQARRRITYPPVADIAPGDNRNVNRSAGGVTDAVGHHRRIVPHPRSGMEEKQAADLGIDRDVVDSGRTRDFDRLRMQDDAGFVAVHIEPDEVAGHSQ